MLKEICEEELYHPVAEFYEGKSIFLTGATGFLGKVLLERLLWNCPKLDKIYILVREKNGVNIHRRIEELLDNALFSKLREHRPDDFNKIIPIGGDISLDNLGINNADENILVEKVVVVIHVAATIRFNEPLKQAIRINLEGTNKILSLCYKIKKLEVFVHTSTAYTNTDKKLIQEIIYPAPADLTDIYHHVENNHLNADITKLLNGQPNTYTFTKAVSENLISERHKNITTIIIRPSIVTAVANEPLPGWIDNWYGATIILTSISKGINRILWGDINSIVDLIPVDYVANFFLVAIAKGQRPKSVVVYNCCSSYNNPINYKNLLGTFVNEAIKHGDNIFPLPQLYFMTNNKIFGTIVTVFLQILPAVIADLVRWIFGKSTWFVQFQKSSVAKRDQLKFFTSNSWLMQNSEANALYSSLSIEDKKQFPCDATQLNWSEYIPIYCTGIRHYLENK